MKTYRNRARRGFSLVELLAVVLILAVLAAVAIPLYLNTRGAAAARTCKANIAAIAAAETAYALRNGAYTGTLGNLVGATEGLALVPVCPSSNTNTYSATISGNDVTIACSAAGTHATFVGATTDYSKALTGATAGHETIP